MIGDYRIILGSASPRRSQLLAGLDVEFEVRVLKGLEEKYPAEVTGAEVPLYLSKQKSEAYALAENELLITADTVVYADGKILGKPASLEDAKAMLWQLSGRKHEVITGVCVRTRERMEAFAATTVVSFATLTDEEIDYYVEKYRPMDKAGSYGVQEWIGYVGVESIEGSYYNVMGLPIQRLYTVLKSF